MRNLPPVILENDVVRLEPLAASHRDALLDAVGQTDQAMWTYMMKNPKLDFENWFADSLKIQAAGKQIFFVVFDRASGRAVGSSSYLNIEPGHDRLEIGTTWYVPAAQGTAVNPATKLALMAHAFEAMGVHRLEFKCDALNTRSRRAILKLGATEDGTLREHMKVPDHKGGTRYRDTVYYCVLEREWPQVKHSLQQRIRQAVAA